MDNIIFQFSEFDESNYLDYLLFNNSI